MAKMGTYCKAYPIGRFREFPDWTENTQNLRKERTDDGQEVQRQLTDDSFLYLQENYVVTDGIFLDENIVYDNVTPEWIEFCKESLKFEVPVYNTVKAGAAETEPVAIAGQ